MEVRLNRDALRRLEEEARAAFRAELDERVASLDRGEWVDPAEAIAELQRKSAERRRKTAGV